MARAYTKGLGSFLTEYAPDFCWCTVHDLFLIAEQKFEDVEYYSFKVTLSELKKKGIFKHKADNSKYTRQTDGGTRNGLYLRIANG